MRVVHVLWGLVFGGIETMIVNIANKQAKMGHSVSLIIINRGIDDQLVKQLDSSISLLKVNRPDGSKNPYYIFKLNYILRKSRPDIVHFHRANMARWIFGRSYVKRSCTTQHINWTNKFNRYLKDNSNFVAISDSVRQEMKSETGINPVVIENGIAVSKFRKKQHPYDGTRPFRIVQVGRLIKEHKGQHILIKAAKILKERGLDFEIDFIGRGDSREEFDQMIHSYGLQEIVHLCGPKPPYWIWENLAGYDLLVQPSLYEGFGLTIVEGMAAGVPALVSDIDVQLEVCENGNCAYVFHSENPESCADRIEEIIRNYDMTITEKALARVKNKYDVSVTAAKYLDYYIRIIQGNN